MCLPSSIFVLCRGFALEQWEEAIWLGKRLNQSREDDSIGIGPWKDWDHPTTRLAVALSRFCVAGSFVDISDLELGVYKDVFHHWSNDEQLAQALSEAGKYHSMRITERGENFYEFSHSPFDVFPVELHAIRRVRERLGLTTPPTDYYLMQTPFGNPPKNVTPTRDELLESALAKIREVIPIF